MIRNKFTKLAIFCAAGLVATGAGFAQNMTQGAISGTVFDATNAAVPGATILIHNDSNGANLTIKSAGAGEFRAPQLAPGPYTVTITAPNFAPQKQSNVIVQVNEVTELNPHLSTGTEATTVEVTAEIPVLKFESADFGGFLDTKEIESIPINNRRWSSLALTTPGVVNDGNGFGLLSFRAISPLLNVVEIDGADDNQAFFAEERGRTRAGYSTAQVAVREFTVNTGVYGADFGRAVGGVVNTVTKSGGNQFHGELYFYNRNSSRSSFQPGTVNTTFNATTGLFVTSPYKPKDNRNEYGFGVGGPIIKDKLFFFYAFDAYRRNFPGTGKASNPGTFFVAPNAALSGTEACNATTGAYTGAPTTLQAGVLVAQQTLTDQYGCQLAARLTAAGTPTTYTQVAGPAGIFNAQLQGLLPDLGTVPRFGNQLINTPKLDYQLGQKNHVSLLYHRLRWDSPGGVQTQSTNTYAVDTFGTDFVKLDYTLAKLDTLINDHFTNEVRYQYGRELNDEGNQTPSAYTTANLFNGHATAPEVGIGIGSGSVGNGFYAGQPYYGFRVAYPDERKWQVGDTASYTLGKHSIRFGTDIVHNTDLQNNVYESNGFIVYANVGNYFADQLTKTRTCDSTGATAVSPTANPTGSFPCWLSYAQGFGPSTFSLATIDMGYFVQDDWKVTPRLTVNLGARYDVELFPSPFAGLNGTAAGAPAVTSIKPSDTNNIAPRIGFAWDPYGLGKTVVRGGFGMYYGRVPNAVILNTYENTGSALSQSTNTFTTTSVANTALPTLQNPATAPAPGALSAYYFQPHYQNPYTEQFDLAVQQDLGTHNVLSVSYVGALGRELPNFLNFNLDPTQAYNVTYNVVANASGTCGNLACGQYNIKTYAQRITNNQAGSTFNNITPLPSFGNVTSNISNINSSYHAASVDVTNRTYRFITFDANYTWSHALDFAQNAFTSPSANNWLDPFGNARENYANSSLNVRHRVVGWAVLNAPGIHGHGALSYVTNGWSIKPLIQIQSGLPYSQTYSGTVPQQCYLLGCLASSNGGIQGTAASSNFLPFTGRNTFTLPRTTVVDARVEKDFTFAEKYNLQLIGEAFNLANHVNITGAGSTAGYAIATTKNPAGSPATPVNTLTYNNAFSTTTTVASGATANSNFAYSPRLLQIAARIVF